ncbi:MAG: cupin domain-containing protein [Burkholderiales bacterium]
MGRIALPFFVASIVWTTIAAAQGNVPVPITPDDVRWVRAPMAPGIEGAWFLGGEDQRGLYVFRVRLAAGARIPPHTHPDERSTTVLSGTIYIGFGETFDESRAVAIPAGSMYVAPAGVPHYVWARDGEAAYQESGIGPSGTTLLNR